MAAALEETPITYEELADIEREFDDVETEIIRQQVTLTQPLYTRRTKTISQIPNFWPLVLEQAPPDIDQYIQPSDSALLLSSLTNLSVSHFEIEPSSSSSTETNGKAKKGDPRSVAIRFEFAENEYFTNTSLEKKFWFRRAKDGWTGLVSEPVAIDWKTDRDLTGGLLDMVVKAWEISKSTTGTSNGKGKAKKEPTPEQKALLKKIENTGMGGLSFFAWFGFIGRYVSAEESAEATKLELEKRGQRANGNGNDAEENKEDEAEDEEEEEEEEEEDDEDLDLSLEIFPDGDDLAIAFSEDLWPGAIKYFTQAQEQDALSDADFESDDEDLNEILAMQSGSDDDAEGPAKKKLRSE